MKTIGFVALPLILGSMALAGPPRYATVPRGQGYVVVRRPVQGPMVAPRGYTHRGLNGYYYDKATRTWRHDGGSHPDTNYPGREYLQLEDPEGVFERTNRK